MSINQAGAMSAPTVEGDGTTPQDMSHIASQQSTRDLQNSKPRKSDAKSAPDCEEEKGEIEGQEDLSGLPECPVCLQQCIHPVRLPCQHVFCFLCVKGAANQSKRCALCRRLIPIDYFNKPTLIRKEDLVREMSVEDGYLWFYEGTNGWWQYDERASKEIEEHYKAGEKSFDLLIAGFLYVIDMENMLQVRRNDTTRRRRIKRDAANTPKKGVAGLKMVLNESQDREGAYGSNSSSVDSKKKKVPTATLR